MGVSGHRETRDEGDEQGEWLVMAVSSTQCMWLRLQAEVGFLGLLGWLKVYEAARRRRAELSAELTPGLTGSTIK